MAEPGRWQVDDPASRGEQASLPLPFLLITQALAQETGGLRVLAADGHVGPPHLADVGVDAPLVEHCSRRMVSRTRTRP